MTSDQMLPAIGFYADSDSRLLASKKNKIPVASRYGPNPHFSHGFYCGGGSGHVYRVALPRAPRRTVEYARGALGRAPCIHARLRRLATKPVRKAG